MVPHSHPHSHRPVHILADEPSNIKRLSAVEAFHAPQRVCAKVSVRVRVIGVRVRVRVTVKPTGKITSVKGLTLTVAKNYP